LPEREARLIYFIFLVTACSVVACHVIARKRGLDLKFWIAAALLAGPFAIPFALFAKPANGATRQP
jgi:hypothetical protein